MVRAKIMIPLTQFELDNLKYVKKHYLITHRRDLLVNVKIYDDLYCNNLYESENKTN